MPPSPDREATAAARLTAWLHALWGDIACVAAMALASSPPDDAVPQRPILCALAGAQRMLHLPMRAAVASTEWGLAAASHAAAHWRFGGLPQPRAGFKPVQLALFGVLEDARVEALALRELPGLRALWLPFHQSEAAAGMHFEALLARLSRSLLDPGFQDPHPWVARARAMFFERDGVSLALRTPADVRTAASLLGNDIGQMRLPFNPRTYRVHAAYRDDNSHLWEPDATLPESDQPLAGGVIDDSTIAPADGVALPPQVPICYPEWDHRISRYRPVWTRVYESAVRADSLASAARADDLLQWRLIRSITSLRAGPPRASGRATAGDEFHPAALVDARVDQRMRRTPDDRIFRRLLPPRARLSVLLLVDASASTKAAGSDGMTLLDRMLAVARACAGALEAHGHASAVMAFASRSRQHVDLLQVKDWHEVVAQVRDRWSGVHAGGSTRTGSALRHATARLLGHDAPGARPTVLLLSDGEPHDVDVHDPLYLGSDLRRASAEALARGVAVRALAPVMLRRRGSLHLEIARLLAA